MRLTEDIAAMQLTRGEFLKLVGIGLLSAFGVARLLRTLSEQAHVLTTSHRVVAHKGFGAGRFGS